MKVNKKEPYPGLKVTPENRWKLIRAYQTEFVSRGMDSLLALGEAKHQVRREQRRWKAWMKGKKRFTHGYKTLENGNRVRNIIDIWERESQ
jgi:hypothetical protein